ncbi:hypothetical protein SLEP1_g12730 [Rubroshorea leprosula]|uniref:Uncharacterized protein n=1 Tax=Rubroshorea leprosula TaxID=152421 RepID=A0AAV5IDF8_9ROSI|nr:hypothetical protein SLEP1_g12730 [Rubroshorea leprosula]
MKEALQRMETEKEQQMEEAEQVPPKEGLALRRVGPKKGPKVDKGLIQPMGEKEQGLQKEELVLHGMEENQGLQIKADQKGIQEEALHPTDGEQGLHMEETLTPMQAEQGLKIEEALALHRMEAEQGLQMEEAFIIHLMEAELAVMRARTSHMREKQEEMEAAVEAKRNGLELRKINRDRRLAQLLLLEEAEQVLLGLLFPPLN